MNFIVAWIEKWFSYCFGKCIFNEIPDQSYWRRNKDLLNGLKSLMAF
jgi:hypothetical protein